MYVHKPLMTPLVPIPGIMRSPIEPDNLVVGSLVSRCWFRGLDQIKYPGTVFWTPSGQSVSDQLSETCLVKATVTARVLLSFPSFFLSSFPYCIFYVHEVRSSAVPLLEESGHRQSLHMSSIIETIKVLIA